MDTSIIVHIVVIMLLVGLMIQQIIKIFKLSFKPSEEVYEYIEIYEYENEDK